MSDTVFVTNLGGALGNGLTGGYSVGQTLAVSLTSAQASLASKTAVTASYATLASVSLAAGTWLVVGHASVGATNLAAALAASAIFGVRIFDGTNPVASAHGGIARDATTFAAQITSVGLVAVVTLASTSTISLQIDGTTTLSAYHQEQGSGDTTGNATRISAIRIA
jgi:hypothetical protein